MMSTAVGVALHTLRTGGGMTLDEVATSAGVSVSYLSRVERGLAMPSPGWVRVVTATIGQHIISTSRAVSG
ncbi:hypothetical protein GCM10022234_35940 [Aeromicrobium panaciterrae]|uniref:helix-turn-helix domain-containing protein n=1 Tax=Aeromicrobium panaciterrae TaxID=363861 RepID=UPI00338872B0